jgi:hypothetical protein
VGLDINIRDDIWTWLSVCATSAAMRLEDHACHDYPQIFEARTLSDAMVGLLAIRDDPEYLAQLMLCERIARLATVFEALASFRNALLASIDNVSFDAQRAIRDALSTAKIAFGAAFERFKYHQGRFRLSVECAHGRCCQSSPVIPCSRDKPGSPPTLRRRQSSAKRYHHLYRCSIHPRLANRYDRCATNLGVYDGAVETTSIRISHVGS